jgi:hypothetical protein
MFACRALLLTPLLAALACQEPVLLPDKRQQPTGGDSYEPGDGDEQPGDGATAGDTDPVVPTIDGVLGVYDVSGSDAIYGAYTGKAELRANGAAVSVIHTIRWTSATFEGLRVAQAWRGDLVDAVHPFTGEVSLDRARFIKSYGGTVRTAADSVPRQLRVELRRTLPTRLEATITDVVAPSTALSVETWTYSAPSGVTAIWTNERARVPAHSPMSEDDKESWHDLFESFYELPDVAPYVGMPDFEAAMNYVIQDPTDFDYLRQNPDTVRVLQAVVDPVSLAEARLRQRGYAYPLFAKAAGFDAQAPLRNINGAGFMASWDPVNNVHRQSGDSLLWTGMYIASQSLRFATTGESVALDNVRRSLDALFTCRVITGQDGQFCRSLRPHVEDGDSGWVRGAPPYEHLDWLQGGNNDMAHGLAVGFVWGWLALEQAGGDGARTDRIIDAVEHLLEHSDIIADGKTNEMKWLLMHHAFTDHFSSRLKYELMFPVLEPVVIDAANGTTYTKGVSLDASGSHLTIISLLTLWRAAQIAGISDQSDYRVAMRNGIEVMRGTRLGLYQLVGSTVGDFATPPPELEEALWTMREYPLVKQSFDLDHRISNTFSLSPWPALPWKNDWLEDDRTRSLVTYPLFERNPDEDYQWKAAPNSYRGAPVQSQGANIDFLFAYWFGRHYGVITPSM